MTMLFRAAGFETADIDARFLAKGVLGLDGAALLKDPDRPLGARCVQLEEAVRRRLAHEPVSRILGSRDFYGRSFEITPDVLDPRADTETLVELVLEIADEKGWRERSIAIADIGTGSGILIVTLLAELPLAAGVATDVSGPALAVAKANARRYGVSGRIKFLETRGLGGTTGPYDLVVSNPPYIPTANIAGLSRDVRAFDPLLALDGGPDGLEIYREIANEISFLYQDAWIALEVGAGQADDVAAIFSKDAAQLWRQRRDLGGHTRAVAFEHHR